MASHSVYVLLWAGNYRQESDVLTQLKTITAVNTHRKTVRLVEGVGVFHPLKEKTLGRYSSSLPVSKGHLQDSWGGTVYTGMQQQDKGQ